MLLNEKYSRYESRKLFTFFIFPHPNAETCCLPLVTQVFIASYSHSLNCVGHMPD